MLGWREYYLNITISNKNGVYKVINKNPYVTTTIRLSIIEIVT
jgi:hypothetical protein